MKFTQVCSAVHINGVLSNFFSSLLLPGMEPGAFQLHFGNQVKSGLQSQNKPWINNQAMLPTFMLIECYCDRLYVTTPILVH